MQFVLICLGALLVLGVVAILASVFTKGGTDAPVEQARDCSTCSSVADGSCRIGCIIERQKTAGEKKNEKKSTKNLAVSEKRSTFAPANQEPLS